jgi:hypothetical protein
VQLQPKIQPQDCCPFHRLNRKSMPILTGREGQAGEHPGQVHVVDRFPLVALTGASEPLGGLIVDSILTIDGRGQRRRLREATFERRRIRLVAQTPARAPDGIQFNLEGGFNVGTRRTRFG